ncbi:phage holin family protein [Listeria monocytogenes]|uniref:Phage holin family protein n=2 Tax=Listeria monocytogenes TaxID=1639 RepID=A0A0B8RIE7_LISMN|nr:MULTISPECIES: phage holin family protein [Listeria]EAE1680968.1 phage holin family protein [Listeria monocytogenes LIS0071]EAE3706643.1 phage holin family protein [Listeria monocytogenes serotype 1/2b]EAF3078358.1 phage holin family protein [Listeria monocytogenes serotype 1/2a]EAG6254062.1 phage holin family protein [Listeria monocytogenes CFSAN003806]EAG6262981.1 phage holin family protein [Listeria monocytogenes CFSAN003725]EAG6333266.1 phage holin family protein [Listeria monocytogenes
MRWIIGVIINSVLFVALSGFFTSFHVDGFTTALLASFILAILNMLIRPILLLLTLPINIFTLGLFTFVVNAIMLEMTTFFIGDSFQIDGFGTALILAAIMAFANMIINSVLWGNKEK